MVVESNPQNHHHHVPIRSTKIQTVDVVGPQNFTFTQPDLDGIPLPFVAVSDSSLVFSISSFGPQAKKSFVLYIPDSVRAQPDKHHVRLLVTFPAECLYTASHLF